MGTHSSKNTATNSAYHQERPSCTVDIEGVPTNCRVYTFVCNGGDGDIPSSVVMDTPGNRQYTITWQQNRTLFLCASGYVFAQVEWGRDSVLHVVGWPSVVVSQWLIASGDGRWVIITN